MFGDREREVTEDDKDDIEDMDHGDVEDTLAGGVDIDTELSTFKEIRSDNTPCIEDEDPEN